MKIKIFNYIFWSYSPIFPVFWSNWSINLKILREKEQRDKAEELRKEEEKQKRIEEEKQLALKQKAEEEERNKYKFTK